MILSLNRKLVDRLESLKKLAAGNGTTECILCGDSFGLSVFGRTNYKCCDCKKVMWNVYTTYNVCTYMDVQTKSVLDEGKKTQRVYLATVFAFDAKRMFVLNLKNKSIYLFIFTYQRKLV